MPFGCHNDFCLREGMIVQLSGECLSSAFGDSQHVQGWVHVLVNCASNTKQYDMMVYSVLAVPNAGQVLVQLHMLFMGSVSLCCPVRVPAVFDLHCVHVPVLYRSVCISSH